MAKTIGLLLAATVAMALGVSAAGPVCVFFTGVGELGPQTKTADPVVDPKYVLSSLPKYWGDSNARALRAGCSKVIMYWTDTTYRGWSDASLQDEYCRVTDHYKADIIFTHSMANMIVAAGIHNGHKGCANIGTGKDNVQWVGLQGPMKGSFAANGLEKLCENPLINKLFAANCIKSNGKYTISQAYGTLKPANVPAWLMTTASEHMVGNLCGTTPANSAFGSDMSGLTGLLAKVEKAGIDVALTAARDLLDAMYGAKTPKDWTARPWIGPTQPVPAYGTDGLVELDSCLVVSPASYKKDPASKYYILDGNHADGRCSFGQDTSSPATQPCTYVANRIHAAMTLKGMPLPRFAQVHSVAEEVEAEVEVAEDEIEAEEEEKEEEADEAEDADEEQADEEEEAEEEAEKEGAAEEEAEEAEEEEAEAEEEEAEEADAEEEAEESEESEDA